jgi:hypothetical protein
MTAIAYPAVTVPKRISNRRQEDIVNGRVGTLSKRKHYHGCA